MNDHAPGSESTASHAEQSEEGSLGLPVWPYYVYREMKVSGTTTTDVLTGPSRGVAVEVNAHTNFRWIRPMNPRMNINTLGEGPVKAVVQSAGDRLSAHSSDEATVLGHMRRHGSRELLVAIKVYDPDQNYDEEILMRELPLWVSMSHPRILPLVGVCMWPGNRYAAVMPYMPGSHIMAYLGQHPDVDRLQLVRMHSMDVHLSSRIIYSSHGLRADPSLSLQEVIDALNPRDDSIPIGVEGSTDNARSTIDKPLATDHEPDDPRDDPLRAPGDISNLGSVYSCASWASTPGRASSLVGTLELVEETLQVDIDGRQVDIVLPRQRPVRGGSGEVRKGYAEIDGATRALAVKVCHDRKVMPREYAIWKSLSHENILRLCGALDWTSPQRKQCVFVSPFMKNGSLDRYLKLNPLCERLPLMIDVATGLVYLHDTKELVHGDIKAENILITDDGRAQLADFGLSTTVASGAQATGFDIRQLYTLAYCAPEIVDDEAEYPSAPGVKRSKTKMSDMYAFGVLLYQTYAGGLARSQGARIRLMAAMYEGQFPLRPTGRLPVLCDDLWSICTRCWARVATDRPTIATVLSRMREL